jgi:uncharacterized membrane protein HdeD (DUF308 family)
MLQKIANHWWLFILRGLIAITFGIVAIVKPEQTIIALVLVFGAFTLVDGIFTLVTSFGSAAYFDKWWLLLIEGAAGIIVGCLAIFMPAITSVALLYLIAAWALVTGIFEIAVAIEFRRVISGEWMLILGGLLSIVLGVLLFIFPGAGELSLIWLIGIYAIVFGFSEIVFAFRLHGIWQKAEKALHPAL